MTEHRYSLVLSIYVTTRGFAFTLFEGPFAPVDWGITEKRGLLRNRRCLGAIERLLQRYRPSALVLQDTSERGTVRTKRIRKLNRAVRELADGNAIAVFVFSRAQVREYFASFSVPTKQGIAEAIAKHVPAFERYLPPVRRAWMSEDSRMGLFDAAALILTFFHSIASTAAAVR